MSKNTIPRFIFGIIVVAVLTFGWSQREEYWLTAEKGWGYALGITGGSLMLLLLLYPLRKHWKVARNWFHISHWFRMHMIFGIIGPVLILFHSNFHLGSLNSNIALFSMLLVSSSGLVGRYAYRKIHRGLYGKQIKFSELKTEYDSSKTHFLESELFDQRLRHKLQDIEHNLNTHSSGLFKSVMYLRHIKKILAMIKKRMNRHINNQLSDAREVEVFKLHSKYLRIGLNQLSEMARYSIFSKLFSLWHVFHIPIFFMMIVAGVVHVFVVHIY
ncbi:MAG: hypothetical protein GY781_00500 [Gammaproteobacteria bacterium]|nr:hypothetical protein [Gammaproteobacteria bacterium]